MSGAPKYESGQEKLSSVLPGDQSIFTCADQLLQGKCSQLGYLQPVYNIVSDRRGGRTAWSSTVTVQGRTYSARFWYDGQQLNNAKNDAAEVACNELNRINCTAASYSGSPASPGNNYGGYGQGNWGR